MRGSSRLVLPHLSICTRAIIAVHLGLLVLLLRVAICPLSIVLILADFVVIRAQYQNPRAPFYVEHPSSLLWQVQFKGELRFKGFSCKLISLSKPGIIRVTHVQRHHLDFVLTKYQLNAPIIPLHCQTANLSLCSQLSTALLTSRQMNLKAFHKHFCSHTCLPDIFRNTYVCHLTFFALWYLLPDICASRL